MLVEVTETVDTLGELLEFLQKFPTDTHISDIRLHFNVKWHAIVSFYVLHVEMIQCGDHLPDSGEGYPLDLLVSLHSHEAD